MATPEGNDVDRTLGVLAALVTAELPYHARTPIGPSAILMAGMPRRSMGIDSIQPEPASMDAFSSSVMRPSRSFTRSSNGVCEFLYGASAGTAVCPESEAAASSQLTMKRRVRRLRGIFWLQRPTDAMSGSREW